MNSPLWTAPYLHVWNKFLCLHSKKCIFILTNQWMDHLGQPSYIYLSKKHMQMFIFLASDFHLDGWLCSDNLYATRNPMTIQHNKITILFLAHARLYLEKSKWRHNNEQISSCWVSVTHSLSKIIFELGKSPLAWV